MFRKIIEFINKHRGFIFYDAKLDAFISVYYFLYVPKKMKHRIVIKCKTPDSGFYTFMLYENSCTDLDYLEFTIKDHEFGMFVPFLLCDIKYFLNAPSHFDVNGLPWYKIVYQRYKHCANNPELYPNLGPKSCGQWYADRNKRAKMCMAHAIEEGSFDQLL